MKTFRCVRTSAPWIVSLDHGQSLPGLRNPGFSRIYHWKRPKTDSGCHLDAATLLVPGFCFSLCCPSGPVIFFSSQAAGGRVSFFISPHSVSSLSLLSYFHPNLVVSLLILFSMLFLSALQSSALSSFLFLLLPLQSLAFCSPFQSHKSLFLVQSISFVENKWR